MEEPPEVNELVRELGSSLLSEAASSGGIGLPGCVRGAAQLGLRHAGGRRLCVRRVCGTAP